MSLVNGVVSRVRENVAPALQAALCATVAWWVAATFLHAPQNFFAPFAAVVVVLGGRGGRGSRALRVVAGGVVGVGLGELALVVGQSPVTLFLAATVAMLIAAAITPDPLIMIQAGVGAVLVAITVSPLSGFGRISAALIGGVIALIATQVVFTPAPGRLAGPPLARVLDATADALDDPGADDPIRELSRALTGLDEIRGGLTRISRFTVRGRIQHAQIRAATESVDAAADLAVAVLTRSGALQDPAREANRRIRASRLRDIAGPARHVGRPGRRIPAAQEIRALDQTEPGVAADTDPGPTTSA